MSAGRSISNNSIRFASELVRRSGWADRRRNLLQQIRQVVYLPAKPTFAVTFLPATYVASTRISSISLSGTLK